MEIPEELAEEIVLEVIRQEFENGLASQEESSSDSDEDTELGSEPEFIEVESDEDDTSDEEGLTIYKDNSICGPCEDCDCEEEEADEEEEEDSEGEDYSVIDLTDDVANSDDFKLEEIDGSTYRLTVRLPSVVKEELKIEFLKQENELVIKGKLNFNSLADSDEEDSSDDEDEEGVETTKLTPAEFIEYSLLEDDDEDEEEDEDFNEDDDMEDISSDEEEEEEEEVGDDDEDLLRAEASDDDEEIQEDAEKLIKEYKDQEFYFEKHFEFDKLIKFNKIKARFVDDDVLELTIPNKNKTSDDENSIAIDIEPFVDDESSTTEEYV